MNEYAMHISDKSVFPLFFSKKKTTPLPAPAAEQVIDYWDEK